jgi:membrane associated rhomboid family serine protease
MANTGFGGLGSIPTVVKYLLIANIVVFLAQNFFMQQGTPLEIWGALWALKTGNFKIWQLITHLFMHASFTHILFNMFGLWMFGSILENHWGSKRFFNFYFICGILAGVVQLVSGNFDYAIGASGAVMGILAGFAYLFPNTELYIMFIPIPIKAKYLVPGLILVDLFSGISPKAGDNVAHWAHLGGALAGLLLVIIWNKNNRKTFY